MRVIHKYELEKKTEQMIVMSEGSIVRHVGVQNDEIFVWVEVDTEKGKAIRRFGIFATGEEMQESDPRFYLETVHWKALILHIYMDAFERCPLEGA